MAKDSSFDIVSEIDLQEVDNAVNQAMKEIKTRFDFRGSKSEVLLNREEKKLTILADDDMKMKNVSEILKTKFSKRGVSARSLKYGEAEKAMDGMIRQTAEIIQGIPQEQSKEIVKWVKEKKLKVQASIQGEQVRISGRSRDDLQAIIQALKAAPPINLPLQCVNYR